MRVGELARRTGVGVSTLRAWESRFRFLEPQRSPAGQRLYDEADVQRVDAVVRLMAEGLHLAAAIARVGNHGPGAMPPAMGEELLFGQILEAAHQGVWVSKHGRTRYTNRRMAEMMGYTPEELLAIPVLEFFDADVLPEIRQHTVQVRAGERLHFTTELRRADGSSFLADITTTPLLTPSGRYDGGVALVNDITARREAEVRTRIGAALFDTVAEAVVAATRDGRIVDINGPAEQLLGWRRADVVGQQVRMLSPITAGSAQAARIESSLAKGRRYTGTLPMVRRDGAEFLAHVSCVAALDDEGVLIGLVATIDDESARLARQQERRNRRLQAETVALLGAQALLQRRETSEAGRLFVTEVVEATRRLLSSDHAFFIEVSVPTNELRVRLSSPPRDDEITVPAGSRSFAGYVALAGKVVIFDGLHPDHRFELSTVLGLQPTSSGVGAPIYGDDGVVGVLTAVSTTPASFDHRDGDFVQAMANVAGSALLSDRRLRGT
jgi:PAS domain S-box-containing protein